jgi:hypothetical protein
MRGTRMLDEMRCCGTLTRQPLEQTHITQRPKIQGRTVPGRVFAGIPKTQDELLEAFLMEPAWRISMLVFVWLNPCIMDSVY